MGIVYLLTHEAMPGLTKIGRTEQSVEERMRSLNNTSVPYGFECFYAAEVADAVDVEKRLHDAFEDLHHGKEFFKMHPLRAQRVLEMVAISDKTPREDVVVEPEEIQQLEKNREYLNRFSMFRIGLKTGDPLVFARGEGITAEVHSDSEVLYEGTPMSLTAAALKAIHKCGYRWQRIAGPVFWLSNGQPLKEIERIFLEQLG
jgi:hypothetical protein